MLDQALLVGREYAIKYILKDGPDPRLSSFQILCQSLERFCQLSDFVVALYCQSRHTARYPRLPDGCGHVQQRRS